MRRSASASSSLPRVRPPWKIGTFSAPVNVYVPRASLGVRPMSPKSALTCTDGKAVASAAAREASAARTRSSAA